MSQITFYPLGNADCCLIQLDLGKLIAFDFADMHNGNDEDKRMPLTANFKNDIGWPDRKAIDILAITHGDNDHVKGIPDTFWLLHATKYQDDDRIRANELWVPAALIVEEGSEDDTKILRAEARYRFLRKEGIRVFARPERLKHWLEVRGKKIDDYLDVITDAGQIVPGLNLERDGVEFFVHSPFALRTETGLLDRNQNCMVMQATIRSGGQDTRFLITADSVAEEWQRMVDITRAHRNDHKLAWDIFKIPHHCSYLSMAHEKGEEKTVPTEQFEWLLSQGVKRAVMVSTSWPIPSDTTDQPPHVETYRRYKETRDALDAELTVTMEHPAKGDPRRTIITVDASGATLKKETAAGIFSVTSVRPPRMG